MPLLRGLRQAPLGTPGWELGVQEDYYEERESPRLVTKWMCEVNPASRVLLPNPGTSLHYHLQTSWGFLLRAPLVALGLMFGPIWGTLHKPFPPGLLLSKVSRLGQS